MGLTLAQTVLWYATFGLEVAVCGLAFRRRLYAHLPIFTSYLVLLIVRAGFIYAVYRTVGYASHLSFYSYWISEAALLAARGASIGELVWNASRWYAGLRAILKWVFAIVGSVLLAQASMAALARTSRIPPFVLTMEQSLELAAAIALVLLLVFSRFYDVPLQRLQRLLATGLLFYSLVQVTNNEIAKYGMESHFHWWEAVRLVSFSVALIIWLIALGKPLKGIGEAPQLPEDLERTRNLMRQGTQTLRGLSERLHHIKNETEK